MVARILIIEDNPENLELMTYLLEAFGYSPIARIEGQAGIQTALDQRPDLVICDLQLPDIDGYEVAKRFKSHPQLARTPLLAVTALAMVGDRERTLSAGFNGYIAKPIVPEQFVRQVEVFLAPELHSGSRRSTLGKEAVDDQGTDRR